MNMTLIKYRTESTPYNKYAVVPTCWISDLVYWLTLSEGAKIVSTDNNVTGDPMVPINWPSYEACINAIRLSDLISLSR